MTTNEIKIKTTDSGPIRSLEIILGEPGIYEVRGPNGCGKTTLREIQDRLGISRQAVHQQFRVGKLEARVREMMREEAKPCQ